ncbi:MAG: hypothetical protein ABEJ61_08140 [Haloferacaceae archaeon]
MFSDRGVSETLGFVFVFALIVSTTGLVYTLGTENLRDVRDRERLNNAERAFDVMAENMNDLQRRSVNSRSTEIKLSDAQIYHGDPVTMNVTGEVTGGGTASFSFEREITPIVYRGVPTEETRLVYLNGAVIRDQRDSAVMVREPDYRLTSEAMVLPVIVTRPLDDPERVGGSTTVLVRGTTGFAKRGIIVDSREYDVTINVTTPRANAWRAYLVAKPAVTCPAATNNDTFVSCSFTSDRVYISRSFVNVEFE